MEGMMIGENILKAAVKLNNDSRFYPVLNRLKNGSQKSCTAVFAGGSITAGLYENGVLDTPYPKITADELHRITGADIRLENIGECSFHSAPGLIAYEKMFRDAPPDMVFIEFAVNNAFDKYNADQFESFIRKILSADASTAAAVICCCRSDGFTCEPYMSELAEYYHIPCISVKSALEALNADFSDYSSDGLHPHARGHRLIAELVSYIFTASENQIAAPLPDKAIYGNTMEHTKYFANKNFRPDKTGDFIPTEMNGIFSDGWSRQCVGNEPMSFVIPESSGARALYIVFRSSSDRSFGCADIFVNGELRCSLDGYSICGWDNPAVFGVYLDSGTDNSIEIKMHKGDEKKRFDIFCFGI